MKYYAWARGSHFTGDVSPVARALAQLKAASAVDIVDAAKDPKHAAHVYIFDCDQPEAADRYYKGRANLLVRSIIEVPDKDSPPDEGHRAFYFVHAQEDTETPEPKIVVTHDEVMQTPGWRRQILTRLVQALQSAEKGLHALGEVDTPVARSLRKTLNAVSRELQAV